VDTAGRSPSDPELADLIGVFEPRKNVRTHLVLAANTTPTLANRLLDKFMPFKPSRVVITKLDEPNRCCRYSTCCANARC
jgi:flagellar biosynthesis GTPase FlhF